MFAIALYLRVGECACCRYLDNCIDYQEEGIAMAVSITVRKAIAFYQKNVMFNRKSNSSETVTLAVPQGHKPNSPFVRNWEIAKKNGYNADMLLAMGLQLAAEMGAGGASEFKNSVPRKNAKAIAKPKKKVTAKPKAKAIAKPQAKATNSKAKTKK